MLKRVVVINDDSVDTGGAASVALKSARMLADSGYHVVFISGDDASASPLQDTKVELVALGDAPLLDVPARVAATRGLYNARAAKLLQTWIAANDDASTVYHLHTWTKILSPSIFQSLAPIAQRLIVHAHDFFLACPNGGLYLYPQERVCDLAPMGVSCITCNCDRRGYAHKLWRVLRQQAFRALSGRVQLEATVVAVHEGMFPYLKRGGWAGARVRALRNPVRRWAGPRVPSETRRNVLFIGRLDEDKGADLFAAAVAAERLPAVIIGIGPLHDAIARICPDAQLLGWCRQEQIAEQLQQARMLVVSTRTRESFGLAAIEGLSSGVPLVISRNALISDEVGCLGFGVTYDPLDPNQLRQSLRLLADDDELVRQMSVSAFAGGADLAPTSEQWIESLIDIYDELCAGSPVHAASA
jgi:glycosyltransferase involved in cell wall biosynthesis